MKKHYDKYFQIINKILEAFKFILLSPLFILIFLRLKTVYFIKKYCVFPIFLSKRIQHINIEHGNLVLSVGSKYAENIPIKFLKAIYYGRELQNSNILFSVKLCESYQKRFNQIYNEKYYAQNLEEFLSKTQEMGIKFFPCFSELPSKICMGNIYKFCSRNEKDMLVFAGNSSTVGYVDKNNSIHCFEMKIEELNVTEAFSNPKQYFIKAKKSENYFFDYTIYILNKNLSFNNQYLLIPEKDMQISEKDIVPIESYKNIKEKLLHAFME